jgi:hypothetical protein
MKHESAATRQPSPVRRILPQQRSHSLKWRRSLAFLAFAIFASTTIYPQTSRPNEYQVKAAYIYNFGKFVKWPAVAPANQTGSFTICVLDQDPFGSTLQSTLAGETVGGKPVSIRHIEKAQDASVCHILFIGSAQGKDLSGILSALDEEAVLTVSDMPDFSKQGGIIQFVLEGDRIRFEINLEGAEKSHLVFPSELLKVAVAVQKPARSGDSQ